MKYLFKEMIPVILGILIALFINNWNQQRNDLAHVEKMVTSLSKELEENKSELIERIEEHQQLLDTIEFYQDKAVSIVEFLGKTNGFRDVSIKNTAWKAIVNARIDLLDYEVISLLTSIDEYKGDMKLQFGKIIDLVYSRAESTAEIDIELFKLSINDLMYSEITLLDLHEAFLKRRNK